MTESTSKYILWLPSWYPSKLGPYDGDFIQRHARAAALSVQVYIVFIVRDKSGTVTNDILIEHHREGNLSETIIYYHSTAVIPGIIEKLLSHQKFTLLYKKYFQELFKEKGMPSLVHVHIAFKAGMIALWLKRKFSLPYLLTEQWTVYLEEARPGFYDLSFITRNIISKIFKNASLVLPVSDFLGSVLKKRWPFISYEAVPNVVNTDIFYPEEKPITGELHLLHISTLTYQKNPHSLLQAAAILKKDGLKFTLDIIGPRSEELEKMVKKEDIAGEVNFLGEMSQPDLAEIMRKSDALVLYSRYETFGCVIIEANACGIPVVVTDTSLMRELVDEGFNGMLVKPGSADALADALIRFSENRTGFDKTMITESTKDKYAYRVVSKKLLSVYHRIAGTKKS